VIPGIRSRKGTARNCLVHGLLWHVANGGLHGPVAHVVSSTVSEKVQDACYASRNSVARVLAGVV
jgi:hypothetical protein